jgi:hypothetical protein
MTTKEKLVQNVKDWLQVDKDIKILQKELKERKKRKEDLTTSLVSTMKTNDIDCFDIKEGKIVYTQSKTKTAINKKHIMECLDKYFANNPTIETDDIGNFILNSRTTKTTEGIRLKISKSS